VRAAVLGSPVAHSRSPVLHRAAYAALGLDGWRYDAIECAEADLPGLVEGLGPEWAGLSLTMPLKRVALDVAKEVSDRAAAVGAANTLVLRDGGRFADNTDVAGAAAALRAAGVTAPAAALVLGAGGTAAAVLAALAELGLAEVTVAVRDASRAGELRAAAARLGVAVALTAYHAVPDRLGEFPLLVSTVPAGAADRFADLPFGADQVVFDVLYHPWPTPLAAAALAAGATVVGGLELLLQQAVGQVELMTGRPAPVEAMRTALHAAAD
jgi:shikimate dehydrogenase